ncbi:MULTISPECIES: beta-N-acetylhexosaminidase [Arthrobacter]|uniref:beta-N-acetylhexosaminidase n=2 Tax=Arthrobacter TaxID=1663 RepID=A0ABU9KHV1_9MICC|nr:beta-N-acetylhexosaminidase [Arthrobacter sp. YJM1]MDP5225782.1 beta-N-acetylhexosaminidase [Arthrobacter sp. YJM1]
MTHPLIPAPRSVRYDDGAPLALSAATTLSADPELAGARRALATRLGAATGWDLLPPLDGEACIRLRHDVSLTSGSGLLQEEDYRLSCDGEQVVISAAGESGAFHGVQTLLQLLGASAFRQAPDPVALWEVPRLRIEDGPRFGYRGVMLDVARHFMPKDALLRFIEALAVHRFNVLHLHLSDDQGWRVEIKAFPELTRVGSWRPRSSRGDWRAGLWEDTPHGGFYTQEDLREIVAFAADRHVTVIPEIDVPGHSQAAIAAYPWLGGLEDSSGVWERWGINPTVLAPTERTLDFYRTVLDEIMGLFPGPWISLGGDEVPLDQWAGSPEDTARARELGFDGVAGLHSWFIGQLAGHLRDHGRRTAVWDEIGDGELPDGALVHSWRGYEGGLDALARGYDVVMCPEKEVYLDYPQSDSADEPVPVGSVTTLEKVYAFEPLPPGSDGATGGRLLGAQGNLWTEHLDSPRRVQFAAFPRLCALAEVLWSPAEERDLPDFLRRLEVDHLPRLEALGIEFRPLSGPAPWQRRPGVPGRMHAPGHLAGVAQPADSHPDEATA